MYLLENFISDLCCTVDTVAWFLFLTWVTPMILCSHIMVRVWWHPAWPRVIIGLQTCHVLYICSYIESMILSVCLSLFVYTSFLHGPLLFNSSVYVHDSIPSVIYVTYIYSFYHICYLYYILLLDQNI